LYIGMSNNEIEEFLIDKWEIILYIFIQINPKLEGPIWAK
jgi:hypothetical protein